MLLVWRREVGGDRPFLFRLYASTRAAELDRAGWPMEFRAAFLAQQFEAMCRGYAASFPEADRWIVELDGEPRAAVVVSRQPEEHRVVYLAILPEVRGRGLGTTIMQRLKVDAAEARLPLRLQAFADGDALPWYRRLGFIEAGREGVRVRLEWQPGS